MTLWWNLTLHLQPVPPSSGPPAERGIVQVGHRSAVRQLTCITPQQNDSSAIRRKQNLINFAVHQFIYGPSSGLYNLLLPHSRICLIKQDLFSWMQVYMAWGYLIKYSYAFNIHMVFFHIHYIFLHMTIHDLFSISPFCSGLYSAL